MGEASTVGPVMTGLGLGLALASAPGPVQAALLAEGHKITPAGGVGPDRGLGFRAADVVLNALGAVWQPGQAAT